LIDARARQRKRRRPHDERRETVRERRAAFHQHRFPRAQRRGKVARIRALDADDLDFRVNRFHRDRHARDQPAAADRTQNRVEIRHLFHHLQRERALPRDDVGRVETVDVGEPLARDERIGVARDSVKSFPRTSTRAPSFWHVVILISGA
jgi:hypothetical protein